MTKYKKIIKNDEVLKEILFRYENKISTSLVRKGDGENIIIGYRTIKGIRFSKYIKKLRHFNIRFYNFKFQQYFKKELINSYENSDFLGVPLKQEYLGYTSSVRRYDYEISKYYGFNKNKNLIDSHFHLEFIKNPKNNNLKNKFAQNLISNKNIGIISHIDVREFLESHNSKLVKQFSIPKRDAGLFNKMNQIKFDRIKEKLLYNKFKIDVWFVAAGAYAKPFCNYIKNNGGIAIDIGSAIDTWIGKYHSRKYLRKLINEKN